MNDYIQITDGEKKNGLLINFFCLWVFVVQIQGVVCTRCQTKFPEINL